MEITFENYNGLDLEQALECLPPRYINHPYDIIYELKIIKRTNSLGNQEWVVRYFVESTGGFNQRTNKHLILAVKEKIKDLLEQGIKLSIK